MKRIAKSVVNNLLGEDESEDRFYEPGQYLVKEAMKAIDKIASPHGATISKNDLFGEGTTFKLAVVYDFPEHKVLGGEVKAAAPIVKSVRVTKSDMWDDGNFAYVYDLTFDAAVDSDKLVAAIEKKYGAAEGLG